MNNNYSAGVLIYSTYRDNTYFLLGRDYDNKWSDFGGRSEIRDRNDSEQTASRELYEESLGSIYSIEFVKKHLKNKKCIKIVSKTGLGYSYYMYLFRLNYSEEYRNRFHCTKNYMKNILDKKNLEKNDIRWISLETLLHSIENKSFISLRNVFLNTVKNNIDVIISNTS